MADPTQVVQTQTTIPDYAKQYVEQLLGRYFGGTDASGAKIPGLIDTPYEAYRGQRTADFSALQNQAFKGIAGLTPASQFGTATNFATQAGQSAGNLRYDPSSFANQYKAPSAYQAGTFGYDKVGTQDFTQADMSKYMNPYMQNVVNIQKREAQRQADIMGQQNAAQAIQRGAFGGSGSAIIEAERQRNAMQQLNDIQATGANQAWQQGMQAYTADQQRALQAALANQQAGITTQGMGEQSRQFGYGQGMNAAQLAAQYGLAADQAREQSRQFGANLGLQGLQAQLQAAGALGALGSAQFGQQKDIANLQMQAGQQQQALQQAKLDRQYQDFLAQRQYPYQQLSFASDMLRGLPLSQASQTMFQAPPSMLSQAAGLGTAALGASRLGLFKEGGEVNDAPAGLADLAIYNMG